jgi:3-phosphoshikimate 1-carboxyvinyltransferase
MGARIETTAGSAPVRIRGGAKLRGIDYELPVASAQIKSALLLAGLSATGRTTLTSPGPSRDHTERMLATMGVEIHADAKRHRVAVTGPIALRGAMIEVPGDFSSAAFFIVAACLGADTGLLIKGVGVNSTRTGLLTILESMGAHIEQRNRRKLGAEPVADLFVTKSALRGINVSRDLVPLAIDEFPILFVAAAGAKGRTVVAGAEELRHKESDRIAMMARALNAVGANVEELPDGLVIEGGGLSGGIVDSDGDHRIAMAFAVASLLCTGPVEILKTDQIATSFPTFAAVAAAAGLHVEVAEQSTRGRA